MTVQPGLCQTWSETPKTGFLTTRLISFVFREVLPKKTHKGETTEKGDGEPAPKKAKTDDEHETVTVKKVHFAILILSTVISPNV